MVRTITWSGHYAYTNPPILCRPYVYPGPNSIWTSWALDICMIISWSMLVRWAEACITAAGAWASAEEDQGSQGERRSGFPCAHQAKPSTQVKSNLAEPAYDNIRQALRKASAEYHPDKQLQYDQKWQVLSGEISKAVNDVWADYCSWRCSTRLGIMRLENLDLKIWGNKRQNEQTTLSGNTRKRSLRWSQAGSSLP